MEPSARGEDEAFYRRVKYFAKAAVIAAMAMVVVGFARFCYDLVYSGAGVSVVSGSRRILESLIFTVGNSLWVAGLAIVAVLAARVARLEKPPRWAPRLDEKFVKKAHTVAMAAMAFAGIYIVVGPLLTLGTLTRFSSGSGGLFSTASTIFSYGAGNIIYVVIRAAAFLLGGLIIQALVRIARVETREPDSPDWEKSIDF